VKWTSNVYAEKGHLAVGGFLFSFPGSNYAGLAKLCYIFPTSPSIA